MSKVLYVKANAKLEGESRTFKISDHFIETYKTTHPEDEIITLDLYEEGITFLPKGQLEILHRPNPGEGKGHPILKYAYQFLEADKYVFAEPLWNLSIPAILKAYIDYVCVNGITFKYSANGPIGLCTGKKAINIISRGGEYSSGPAEAFEMADKYLRIIFGFMGITDFMTIAADQCDVMGIDLDGLIENAIQRANQTALSF